MSTTIKISRELKRKLDLMKMRESETYEDILEDLIEDRMQVSQKTRKRMAESLEQIGRGEYVTLEELKRRARLNV